MALASAAVLWAVTIGIALQAWLGLHETANALSMIVFGLGTTVGPLLACVLVANIGYAWTYTVDVPTFAASLWALFTLFAGPYGQTCPLVSSVLA